MNRYSDPIICVFKYEDGAVVTASMETHTYEGWKNDHSNASLLEFSKADMESLWGE